MAYNNLWLARGGQSIVGRVIHFEDNTPPACDVLYVTDPAVPAEFYQIVPFTLLDMWVVGVDYTDATVMARHFDGSVWTSHLEAVPGVLNCANGTTNALHVGGADQVESNWYTRQPIMYYWDGAVWSLEMLPLIETGIGSIQRFAVLSATDIYACGIVGPIGWAKNSFPALWHYNGALWSAIDTSLISNFAPLAVWAADANNIWIVGSNYNYSGGTNPGYEGRIYHYDGAGTFTLQLSSMSEAWANIFHAVFGLSATDVWATGAAIAHWDGATWTQISHSIDPLLYVSWQGLWCFASDDVYISGTSWIDRQTQFILHWDGATLTQVFTEVAPIGPDMIHDMSGLRFVPPTPVSLIAEILIGSQVMWSAENAIPQQTVSLDVSAFEGIFPVKFRIRAK